MSVPGFSGGNFFSIDIVVSYSLPKMGYVSSEYYTFANYSYTSIQFS